MEWAKIFQRPESVWQSTKIKALIYAVIRIITIDFFKKTYHLDWLKNGRHPELRANAIHLVKFDKKSAKLIIHVVFIFF